MHANLTKKNLWGCCISVCYAWVFIEMGFVNLCMNNEETTHLTIAELYFYGN